MERLSRWSGIWKEELDRVEDPFFATSYVFDNLQGRCDLCGLRELLASAVNQYGTEPKTQQHYVKADDHWDISGASWHWRPVLANEVYEFKKG